MIDDNVIDKTKIKNQDKLLMPDSNLKASVLEQDLKSGVVEKTEVNSPKLDENSLTNKVATLGNILKANYKSSENLPQNEMKEKMFESIDAINKEDTLTGRIKLQKQDNSVTVFQADSALKAARPEIYSKSNALKKHSLSSTLEQGFKSNVAEEVITEMRSPNKDEHVEIEKSEAIRTVQPALRPINQSSKEIWPKDQEETTSDNLPFVTTKMETKGADENEAAAPKVENKDVRLSESVLEEDSGVNLTEEPITKIDHLQLHENMVTKISEASRIIQPILIASHQSIEDITTIDHEATSRELPSESSDEQALAPESLSFLEKGDVILEKKEAAIQKEPIATEMSFGEDSPVRSKQPQEESPDKELNNRTIAESKGKKSSEKQGLVKHTPIKLLGNEKPQAEGTYNEDFTLDGNENKIEETKKDCSQAYTDGREENANRSKTYKLHENKMLTTDEFPAKKEPSIKFNLDEDYKKNISGIAKTDESSKVKLIKKKKKKSKQKDDEELIEFQDFLQGSPATQEGI